MNPITALRATDVQANLLEAYQRAAAHGDQLRGFVLLYDDSSCIRVSRNWSNSAQALRELVGIYAIESAVMIEVAREASAPPEE